MSSALKKTLNLGQERDFSFALFSLVSFSPLLQSSFHYIFTYHFVCLEDGTRRCGSQRTTTEDTQRTTNSPALFCFVFVVPGIETRVWHMLSKFCATDTQSQPRKATPKSRVERVKTVWRVDGDRKMVSLRLGHIVRSCDKINKWNPRS